MSLSDDTNGSHLQINVDFYDYPGCRVFTAPMAL